MKQYETLSLPFTCVKGFFTILEKKEERCMIDLRNVEKTYYSNAGDIHALKKTNLHINAGEIFGIIGLSGAGKSTLIRCINMLEVPTGGQVFVDGQELTAMNNQELRKARQNIGMIFQHFNLLSSRTVYGNVALPLELAGMPKDKIREKVMPLIELVGLSEHVNKYPSQLSGGQKQRISIARALLNRPRLLLADEPTGNLDPLTAEGIIRLFQEIARQGCAVVMSTHNTALIEEYPSRTILFSKGKIKEVPVQTMLQDI